MGTHAVSDTNGGDVMADDTTEAWARSSGLSDLCLELHPTRPVRCTQPKEHTGVVHRFVDAAGTVIRWSSNGKPLTDYQYPQNNCRHYKARPVLHEGGYQTMNCAQCGILIATIREKVSTDDMMQRIADMTTGPFQGTGTSEQFIDQMNEAIRDGKDFAEVKRDTEACKPLWVGVLQRDQTGTWWVKITRIRDGKIIHSKVYSYRWFALWRMKKALRRLNARGEHQQSPAIITINNTEV